MAVDLAEENISMRTRIVAMLDWLYLKNYKDTSSAVLMDNTCIVGADRKLQENRCPPLPYFRKPKKILVIAFFQLCKICVLIKRQWILTQER